MDLATDEKRASGRYNVHLHKPSEPSPSVKQHLALRKAANDSATEYRERIKISAEATLGLVQHEIGKLLARVQDLREEERKLYDELGQTCPEDDDVESLRLEVGRLREELCITQNLSINWEASRFITDGISQAVKEGLGVQAPAR